MFAVLGSVYYPLQIGKICRSAMWKVPSYLSFRKPGLRDVLSDVVSTVNNIMRKSINHFNILSTEIQFDILEN